VGFDQPRTLGKNQTGGSVALPVWMGYMEHSLKGVPEMTRVIPPGVVLALSGPDSSTPGDIVTVPEYFYREYVPAEKSPAEPPPVEKPAAGPPLAEPKTLEELFGRKSN
jgi:penicillin-binding protein 1A